MLSTRFGSLQCSGKSILEICEVVQVNAEVRRRIVEHFAGCISHWSARPGQTGWEIRPVGQVHIAVFVAIARQPIKDAQHQRRCLGLWGYADGLFHVDAGIGTWIPAERLSFVWRTQGYYESAIVELLLKVRPHCATRCSQVNVEDNIESLPAAGRVVLRFADRPWQGRALGIDANLCFTLDQLSV